MGVTRGFGNSIRRDKLDMTEPIRRVALGVEYDGSAFSGWQMQNGAYSVQEEVERALSKVANHSVRVTCAGRTDAGVHATGQVVHFDSAAIRTQRAWQYGGNANLSRHVAIQWVADVAPEFHARFSAVRRRYRYVIANRGVRPTFLDGRVTWEYRPLDADKMGEAAKCLVGSHDFSSFRALACQAKSPVREVFSLEVTRYGEFVVIEVEANAFLHHMVRNIAGVLMDIGAGKQPSAWAREVLLARDRTLGGVTAPPHGLYLIKVYYPGQFSVPQREPANIVFP